MTSSPVWRVTRWLDAEFHAVDPNDAHLPALLHCHVRYGVPVFAVDENGSRRIERCARLGDLIHQNQENLTGVGIGDRRMRRSRNEAR